MTSCPACGLATDNLLGHCVDVHKTPLEQLIQPPPPPGAKVANALPSGLVEDRTESGLSVVREDRGPYL